VIKIAAKNTVIAVAIASIFKAEIFYLKQNIRSGRKFKWYYNLCLR